MRNHATRKIAYSTSLAGGAFALALFASVAGCTAHVEPATAVVEADDEVAVDAAPTNVYVYPHTEYRGRTVYLVNGRWYYPRANRWYVYRSEPAPLVRRRHYV